jgi:hypothetical protein
MEEFLLKLSAVWARALENFASPVLDRKISKNVGFKGREIIEQPCVRVGCPYPMAQVSTLLVHFVRFLEWRVGEERGGGCRRSLL